MWRFKGIHHVWQERSQRLYHVEAHQNIWRLKRYLTLLLYFQIATDKGADQTARMRRLICTFVVCKSQGFSCLCSFDVEAQASWPPPGYAPDFHLVIGHTSHLYWQMEIACNQINIFQFSDQTEEIRSCIVKTFTALCIFMHCSEYCWIKCIGKRITSI